MDVQMSTKKVTVLSNMLQIVLRIEIRNELRETLRLQNLNRFQSHLVAEGYASQTLECREAVSPDPDVVDTVHVVDVHDDDEGVGVDDDDR